MLYVICWGQFSFFLHISYTRTVYTLCVYACLYMHSHVGARGQPGRIVLPTPPQRKSPSVQLLTSAENELLLLGVQCVLRIRLHPLGSPLLGRPAFWSSPAMKAFPPQAAYSLPS